MSQRKIHSHTHVDEGLISISPERVSGAPVFAGTRVPVKNLFDYLSEGESLEGFLEDFPGVEREQVVALLERIGQDFNEHGNVQARV